MSEKITIARPYAKAAFEQARDESNLGKWSEILALLSSIVSNPLMKTVISNPGISDDDLYGIFKEICGEKLFITSSNFVRILISAGRLPVLPEISRLYDEKRTAIEGLAEVQVISAFPLLDEQKKKITEAMNRRLDKKTELKSSIDESLIGGAIIKAGDSVIDASIRGRLEQLKNVFAQ